jgi:hypothetical protein
MIAGAMECGRGDGVTTMDALELQPSDMGTLEMDGIWVPYADLYDEKFMPTRVRLGADEYAFSSSQIIFGHGATLPGKIRALRAEGKKVLVAQRGDRYYVFVA